MSKLLTTLLATGLLCQVQAADLFTPVQKTELRAPSVPLITSDPYLSIWSPYDKLNEGITQHWSGAEPITSRSNPRRWKGIPFHGNTGIGSIASNGR